ncbi:MAG: hypothetical protein AAFR58_09695 [Cyanobacteria bacterium J06627_28]
MSVSSSVLASVAVAQKSHIPESGQLYLQESPSTAAELADYAFIEVQPVAANHDMTVPDIAAADVLVATVVPALLLSVLF